jgi:hypothetical protein
VVTVAEPEPLAVPAGGGEHGQGLRADPRPGFVARHRDGIGGKGVDPAAQPGGQHLLELGERAQRGLLDPGDRAAGRVAQPDGDGHGLLVVQQQRRQCGAGTEPVAADRTPGGVHRVAEGAQPLHVVADRPGAHLEALGQLRARPVARHLQQREQAQQPG